MTQAADAIEVDTDGKSINEVVDTVRCLLERRLAELQQDAQDGAGARGRA